MMKRILAILVLCLAAGAAPAQNADVTRVFKAGSAGVVVLSTVAELMIATELCALGDRADWQKVVDAVDRRYSFCVSKDEAWSRLMDDFRKAGADGSARNWGSLGLEALLERRGAEANAMGKEAFCAKMPWNLLLVPGAATDQAKAEYKKANPDANLDNALRFFTWIRTLGTDAAWVEAPCDKDFWPEFK